MSEQASPCLAEMPTNRGLASVRAWLWKDVEVLAFAVDKVEHQPNLLRALGEWQPHVSMKLVMLGTVSFDAATVRISTHSNKGNYSAIGNGAVWVKRPDPTANIQDVNLFWVWLHELGHALGFLHEHQSPKIDMQWNREAVVAFYRQLGKSEDWVKGNVFWIYDNAEATEGDKDSIMMYWLAAGLSAKFPQGTRQNTQLSPLDKAGARLFYPKTPDRANINFINSLYGGLLERPPDEHGQKYFLHRLTEASRQDIALEMLNSVECLDLNILKNYKQLLKRDPKPGEYPYWRQFNQMQTLTGILGSQEYFNLINAGVS